MKDEVFEKAVEIKRSIFDIEKKIMFDRGYIKDLKEYLENNHLTTIDIKIIPKNKPITKKKSNKKLSAT